MALPIAHAPHSGPVDQPGEGAYLWARSAIARSATTRSNYVSIHTSIDWIVRDSSGNITSTTDISGIVLLHSLHVTQALNDDPTPKWSNSRSSRRASNGRELRE